MAEELQAAFPAGSVDRKRYANRGNPPLLAMVPHDARCILDIGCGAGDNARLLVASGRSVDGITLSEGEAATAREVCGSVFVHDLETGLPANLTSTYDAVICSHVLEHLRWPDRFLREVCERLRPQRGVLLVALPNVLFYKNRWRILTGHFDYEESGLMDASHFRWFTYESSRRLLVEAGFEVQSHSSEGSFPLPLVRRVIHAHVASGLDKLAAAALPGLFGYQFLLRAVPAGSRSPAYGA
jgi:SAM-dependent methyltransferase